MSNPPSLIAMFQNTALQLAALAAITLAPAHADILLSHTFGGEGTAPLNGVAPDANVIRPVNWDAGAIIAANGQVTDGANTDQGAVFDLGLSWKFKPQSVYRATLGFSNLNNAIVFAGFRTANPSGSAQAQVQGTVFSLRVREITGSDNAGVFQFPGAVFTNAPELSYPANTSGSFQLEIQTNDLTNATVNVGTAQVTVDLSTDLFRYFFIGFEDPLAASPASDAKFDSVVLEGPALPPLPQLAITSVNRLANEVTLSWPTTSAELYCLQGSGNLVDWTVLDGSDINPFLGTGSPEVFVDPRSDDRYFYRLIRP